MSQHPRVQHVVFHLPGEAWIDGVDFREQDGVMDHVLHYQKWLEEKKLFMGGPFLPPHTGGMMIANANITEEELHDYASQDPAVKSKLLTFQIKSWYVPMSQES